MHEFICMHVYIVVCIHTYYIWAYFITTIISLSSEAKEFLQVCTYMYPCIYCRMHTYILHVIGSQYVLYTCMHIYVYIYIYICVCTFMYIFIYDVLLKAKTPFILTCNQKAHSPHTYGVATISSIDKIIGLFCRILSLL